MNGTVTNQSATSFWLTTGGHTIIFDGSFGIGASNTITGFHVYDGASLLLDASGYSIDRDDFIDGNAAANDALIQLSYAYPVIINGSAGDDLIGGSTAGGSLFGNGGNDTIYGGFGDQLISGGAGSDHLVGDVGDHMGNGNDTVDYSEKTGDVVVTLSTTHATTVTVNGVAEDTIDEFENVNGGSGNDSITGSEVVNILTGNGGNDFLDGRAGGDRMAGGAGNDTYVVDNSGDVVVEAAGQGNDTVLSSISLTLGTNVENLKLTGTAAIDATGNGLANTLTGNAAANHIDGKGGADTMKGGGGNDTYVIDNAGDTVVETAGQGTDLVISSVSHALGANVENLTLTGAADLDGTGNALANAITGNGGDNLLSGGLGHDVLIGGAGDDTFVFDVKVTKKNADTIDDFSVGDHIGLDADVFRKVNDDGALKAKFFAFGHADDHNDYIVARKNGKILYDKDGDGHHHGKLIATVDHGTHLHADDFLIV